MQPVTIYTKDYCPYCERAMALLAKKNAPVTQIRAAHDPALKQEMVSRANGRATYPQIFIGDQHVGGCDDIMALEAQGRLDALLSAAP